MPCECGAKKQPPKKSTRRIRHVEDVQLPDTKADMRAAMRIAANKPKPEPPPAPPTNWEKLITRSDESQAEMEDAIRVLLDADILHPDEQEKYRHLIPVEDRAKAWKERNNGTST
ncbi:MAG TPA: hypothetical protein VNS88_14415 [Nitrospiraceae bacterium]|nr:hypothetical protein [Nitrospiraceae bacterium]